MFLSVVILGGFTTETRAMALHIRTDTPPFSYTTSRDAPARFWRTHTRTDFLAAESAH
jgi:hypothetical protein